VELQATEEEEDDEDDGEKTEGQRRAKRAGRVIACGFCEKGRTTTSKCSGKLTKDATKTSQRRPEVEGDEEEEEEEKEEEEKGRGRT
jgi:hypothetical protein